MRTLGFDMLPKTPLKPSGKNKKKIVQHIMIIVSLITYMRKPEKDKTHW
jgi:hypothetical protein